MENPAARLHVESRFTSDPSRVGSRWERVDCPDDPFGSDHVLQRARFEEMRLRPGLDVRLVRTEWDPEGDEDSMPITAVVAESSGAA